MELGAQIEDLQELQKTTVSGDEMVEIRKKLNEQIQMTRQKDSVIQKERDAVSELQTQLTTQSDRVEQLQEEIVRKDEEKRVMEEKYKTYLEKAKAVSYLSVGFIFCLIALRPSQPFDPQSNATVLRFWVMGEKYKNYLEKDKAVSYLSDGSVCLSYCFTGIKGLLVRDWDSLKLATL